MPDLKQRPYTRNPKSSTRARTPRHHVRRNGCACCAPDREGDAWPYVKGAPVRYDRLRAYASRPRLLSRTLCGLYTQALRTLVESFAHTEARDERMVKLLRRVIAYCIQRRSYGYFYFDTLLACLADEVDARGHHKRRMRDTLHMLIDAGALVFQLDSSVKGGIYRVAFYDHGNLDKQEFYATKLSQELRKNLMISSTCQKVRSHAYKAKALGIVTDKEQAQAFQNIKAKQARERERKRIRESARRAKVRVDRKTVAAPAIAPQTPSRPVLMLTQASTPVSIQKLVTAATRPVARQVRRSDRSGGALGQYRDKLMAMGLTRAVQEYDRIQAARDLR